MRCLSHSGLRWAKKTGIFKLGTLTLMTVGSHLFNKIIYMFETRIHKYNRLNTRGTLRIIRIQRLADKSSKCIEEKGGSKDIHCSAQKATLFVDLL